MRSGFTLVEALVALVLFEIAALALVATTAVAARDLGVADRHARGHALAVDRVARLKGGACAALTAGTRTHPGGLAEHWRVAAAGELREISDSVALALPGRRTTSVVVREWEICPP